MISMHCPSCGAEGRIPNDKVNVRMLCKRCLKSFHLTPAGNIVAGSPPEEHPSGRHGQPGHELDAVEHEVDVVVARLKSAAPKLAVAAALIAALLVGWLATRGGKVVGLDEQSINVGRALAKGDADELRALSLEGTDDEAARLSEALAPEFGERTGGHRAVAPTVEVVRSAEAPGPGLAAIVATIRTDRPVGRMGEAVPDVSIGSRPSAVEVPLILAGDDRHGWRLDGEKSLEAYRKSRAPAAPGRVVRPGAPSSATPPSGAVADAVPGA